MALAPLFEERGFAVTDIVVTAQGQEQGHQPEEVESICISPIPTSNAGVIVHVNLSLLTEVAEKLDASIQTRTLRQGTRGVQLDWGWVFPVRKAPPGAGFGILLPQQKVSVPNQPDAILQAGFGSVDGNV